MTRRCQGVRSSRTGLIKKSEREKLRRLDRQIALLDSAIAWSRLFNPALARKQIQQREKKDLARRRLRHSFKNVGERPC